MTTPSLDFPPVAKKTPETNRRKLIEEQRKKARAKERRTTILTIVLSSVIGIALIAGAVYFGQRDRADEIPMEQIGMTSAEAAGCDAPKDEPLGEGATDEAIKHTTSRVEYAVAPPSSGMHNPTPLPGGNKSFYSRDDNPAPEQAVHNLEHGYVVVWYDNKATDQQVDLLRRVGDAAERKLLILPWTRNDFPDDKHIVLTSWTIKQSCRDVSGAVIKKFFEDYGGAKSKAPEKNAF